MVSQKRRLIGGAIATATSKNAARRTIAAALAGILGGSLLFGLWVWSTVPASTKIVARAEPAASSPTSSRMLTAAPMQRPKALPSSDSTRVKAAFERFQVALKDITKEKLETEQIQVKAALEAARNTATPEPAVETITDNKGLRWNRLMYPSGEVRYEFPID